MVWTQLEARDIRDPRVLEALRTIDRARFLPPNQRASAYADGPLAIGYGQTISQPYIVALMTQELDLRGRERVLEIGTGSGYQTAVLAHLAAEVYTIEVHAPLAERARETLDALGYRNVHYRVGQPWIDQLADGGRLVAPVGGGFAQTLVRLEKRDGRVTRHEFCPCRFVPLVGGNEETE